MRTTAAAPAEDQHQPASSRAITTRTDLNEHGHLMREGRLTSGQAPFVVSHPGTRTSPGFRARVFSEFREDPLVELRGFEPLTPSMPWRCATSCATAPYGYSRAAPVGGDRVSLSGTPRDSPNRSAHTGLVPTFHATIRQVLSYSYSSAQ